MHKLLSKFMSDQTLQAVLTILVWGSICYLYVTGQAVPDALLGAGSIILGFYFHGSAQAALMKSYTWDGKNRRSI